MQTQCWTRYNIDNWNSGEIIHSNTGLISIYHPKLVIIVPALNTPSPGSFPSTKLECSSKFFSNKFSRLDDIIQMVQRYFARSGSTLIVNSLSSGDTILS